MNIFDYAMQLEKEGENFYRDIVKATPNRGLKTIFSWLAEEEVKHYRIFESMKAEGKPTLVETAILQDAKTIFEEMRNKHEPFHFENIQTEAYRKAQAIEKKSQDFYEEKAKIVKDRYQQKLFLQIAEEEKKHYFLLENIIQFVSRPGLWLENAEFYQLEEY